jgi:hypothetical protein
LISWSSNFRQISQTVEIRDFGAFLHNLGHERSFWAVARLVSYRGCSGPS